jgi:hypothetical protein
MMNVDDDEIRQSLYSYKERFNRIALLLLLGASRKKNDTLPRLHPFFIVVARYLGFFGVGSNFCIAPKNEAFLKS